MCIRDRTHTWFTLKWKITIVSISLNEFSSTLLLLKRKRLQVNYPFPFTAVSYTHLDVYKRQAVYLRCCLSVKYCENMPNKCCVPGCKGNYTSEYKVHVFSFPLDRDLCRKWIAAIPRVDFTPTKYTKVCESHFHKDHIVWNVSHQDPKTGQVKEMCIRDRLWVASQVTFLTG